MHFTSVTSLFALAASLAAASPIVPPPDCVTTQGNGRRTEPNPYCPPKPPCQPIATDSNGKRHYPTDCTPPWNGTHPYHGHGGGAGGGHQRPWPDKPDEHPTTNTAVKRHGPKPGDQPHWPGGNHGNGHGHGHGNNGTNPEQPCDDDNDQQGHGKGHGHGPKPEEQPTQTQPQKRTYPDHPGNNHDRDHDGDHPGNNNDRDHDREHKPHKPGEQPHWPQGGGQGHGHGHGNGTNPEQPCETGTTPGGAYPTEGAVPKRLRV